MAEIVRMPRLSDTMTEGVIVSWHKKTGDKVSVGDPQNDVRYSIVMANQGQGIR